MVSSAPSMPRSPFFRQREVPASPDTDMAQLESDPATLVAVHRYQYDLTLLFERMSASAWRDAAPEAVHIVTAVDRFGATVRFKKRSRIEQDR